MRAKHAILEYNMCIKIAVIQEEGCIGLVIWAKTQNLKAYCIILYHRWAWSWVKSFLKVTGPTKYRSDRHFWFSIFCIYYLLIMFLNLQQLSLFCPFFFSQNVTHFGPVKTYIGGTALSIRQVAHCTNCTVRLSPAVIMISTHNPTLHDHSKMSEVCINTIYTMMFPGFCCLSLL